MCYTHYRVIYQRELRHFTAFINPLLWPHGTVKCPSYAHFRFSQEEVGYPGSFCWLFYEYCDILFFANYILEKCAIWDSAHLRPGSSHRCCRCVCIRLHTDSEKTPLYSHRRHWHQDRPTPPQHTRLYLQEKHLAVFSQTHTTRYDAKWNITRRKYEHLDCIFWAAGRQRFSSSPLHACPRSLNTTPEWKKKPGTRYQRRTGRDKILWQRKRTKGYRWKIRDDKNNTWNIHFGD